jgi:hypothetical protein
VEIDLDIGQAIRDVVCELKAHTERDYLRDEFVLIAGKIDRNGPHGRPFDLIGLDLDFYFISV